MIIRNGMPACETCGAVGFDESVLGPKRCTFCDGTENGNPPTLDEIIAYNAGRVIARDAIGQIRKLPPTVDEVVAYRAARKNALFIERYGGKMTEVT